MSTATKETPETLERIRELLRIERQSDGQDWLVWWVDRGGCRSAKAGDRAGGIRTSHRGVKCRTVGINRLRYEESRVFFALYHGRWPNGLIDHRNRDSLDQRIENFRETTNTGNMRNIDAHRTNTLSEFRGVWWDKTRGKWYAHAKLHNVHFSGERTRYSLGRYDQIDDAKNAVRVFWWLLDEEHFPYEAFGLPADINVYRAFCDGVLTDIANGADASAYKLISNS